MKERFRPSDYRFLAICLALLVGTTWFSVRNFHRAFPEASIDFRVNRDDSAAVAARFLAAMGHGTADYRHASRFAYDDEAKTFLEREAGLERANQIMGSRLRLWRWSHRWFQPLQKEEFSVDITTRGELVGFEHEIAEDAARPAVSTGEARAIAEEFLRSRFHRDPATLEFVDSSEIVRPHRVDRTYTWKEPDFNFKDAENRAEVTVLGNEAGGYREYLKVPEQWSRDYQRLRSKNEAAQTVDLAFMSLLLVALIGVMVVRVRRRDVRWRGAALIGVLGMALSFCASLNQFPLQEFGYPTTDSYGSFVSRQLLSAILGALGAGGLLFVLAAGAEPLYREAYPEKISLANLFRPTGLRTKRFFLGAVLGIALTGTFIAYQTGFYMVAYRFGAWSPADVPYSDLLNTRFPWLFVLLGGYLPAVSEEFMFRMFGIPFLRKAARSTAMAIVLAGFIWGFGHAGYPQQPFYIRGVEVGIGGVALGLIMLRWGILPTLVWHYSVDAMYTAMLLLRSQSLYFRLSGAGSAGIIVLPVALALIAYWRRGGFEPEAGLLNADEAVPAEAPPEPAPAIAEADSAYRPLSLRMRIAAVVILGIGLAALLIPPERFGDAPRYRVAADRAGASAETFLRSNGFNVAAFRRVVFPVARWDGGDDLAAKYFLERRTLSAASQLFERNRPIQVWMARYFKSLDREEVSVSVHPETGKILGFRHSIPENRPGADLSEAVALQIGAAFAAAHGYDVGSMDLKENSSEKQKARRDYTLEWEARSGDPRNVGEAHFRVVVDVGGDAVTGMRCYWKVPESFARARSRQNALSIGITTVRLLVLVAGLVWTILLLVQNIRHGMVQWRLALKIAAPFALLLALGPLLSIPLTLKAYNTAIPLETYQMMVFLGIAIVVVFGFVPMCAAAALITSFFPESAAAFRRERRRVLGVDGLATLAAAAGLILLLHAWDGILTSRFHAQALISAGSPDLIVSAFPALAAAAGGAQMILLTAAGLAAAVLIAGRLPKTWMKFLFGVLLACAFLPLDVRTPGEFLLGFGMSMPAVAAAAALCRWFARSNHLAYFLALLPFAFRGRLAELFGNPQPGLAVQGWILVALATAVALWVIAPALQRRPRSSAAGA